MENNIKTGDKVILIHPKLGTKIEFIFDEKFIDKKGFIELYGWGKIHVNNLKKSN